MRFKIIALMMIIQLAVTSCSNQPVIHLPEDAYDYPVRPGTEEWKSLGSHPERVKACQIPESILENMTTDGLVYSVLDYPLLYDMFGTDNPQGGFDLLTSRFNGLQELIKRNDAGKVLLEKYQATNPKEIKKGETFFLFNLQSLEQILCQQGVLDDIDDSQLKVLMLEAKNKYEIKQNLEEHYSIFAKAYSLRIIGKILQYANYQPFEEKISKNKDLKEFLEEGLIYSNSIEDHILSSMEQFMLNE